MMYNSSKIQGGAAMKWLKYPILGGLMRIPLTLQANGIINNTAQYIIFGIAGIILFYFIYRDIKNWKEEHSTKRTKEQEEFLEKVNRHGKRD